MESKQFDQIPDNTLACSSKGPSVFGTIQKSVIEFEKKSIQAGMKLKSLDEEIKLVWNSVLQDRNLVEKLSNDLKKSAADYEIECIKRNEVKKKSECTAVMFEAQLRFQKEISKTVEESAEDLKICQASQNQKLNELKEFQLKLNEIEANHKKNVQAIFNKGGNQSNEEIQILKDKIKTEQEAVKTYKDNLTKLSEIFDKLSLQKNEMEDICKTMEQNVKKVKTELELLQKEEQKLNLEVTKKVEFIRNETISEDSQLKLLDEDEQSLTTQLKDLNLQRQTSLEDKEKQENVNHNIAEKLESQLKKSEDLKAELLLKEQMKKVIFMKISDLDVIANLNEKLKEDKEFSENEIKELDKKIKEKALDLTNITEENNNLGLVLDDAKKRNELDDKKIDEIKEHINSSLERIDKVNEMKKNAKKTHEEEIKLAMQSEINSIGTELNEVKKENNKIMVQFHDSTLAVESLKSQCETLEQNKVEMIKKVEILKIEKQNLHEDFEKRIECKDFTLKTINDEILKASIVVEEMGHLDEELKEVGRKKEELLEKCIQEKESLVKSYDCVKKMQDREEESVNAGYKSAFEKLESKMNTVNGRLAKVKQRNSIWINKIEEKEKRIVEQKEKTESLNADIISCRNMLQNMRHVSGVTWKDMQTAISLSSQD